MPEMKLPSIHKSNQVNTSKWRGRLFSMSRWCKQPKRDQPRAENAHLLVKFLAFARSSLAPHDSHHPGKDKTRRRFTYWKIQGSIRDSTNDGLDQSPFNFEDLWCPCLVFLRGGLPNAVCFFPKNFPPAIVVASVGHVWSHLPGWDPGA